MRLGPKGRVFFYSLLVDFSLRGTEKSKGEFRACGLDQPARLDRAREHVPWTPIVGCGREWVQCIFFNKKAAPQKDAA